MSVWDFCYYYNKFVIGVPISNKCENCKKLLEEIDKLQQEGRYDKAIRLIFEFRKCALSHLPEDKYMKPAW
jgi:hypothetical protein